MTDKTSIPTLGDPFAPKGPLAGGNVRLGGKTEEDRAKDAELRDSMKAYGYLPGHPVIMDENGMIIVGHRRYRIAKSLNVQPEVVTHTFGQGDEADLERLRVMWLSNMGGKGYSPADRREMVIFLKQQRGWTQKTIAASLGMAQQTVSRDLAAAEAEADDADACGPLPSVEEQRAGIERLKADAAAKADKAKQEGKRTRAPGAGRPKGVPNKTTQDKVLAAVAAQGEIAADGRAREALATVTGLSPVTAEQAAEWLCQETPPRLRRRTKDGVRLYRLPETPTEPASPPPGPDADGAQEPTGDRPGASEADADPTAAPAATEAAEQPDTGQPAEPPVDPQPGTVALLGDIMSLLDSAAKRAKSIRAEAVAEVGNPVLLASYADKLAEHVKAFSELGYLLESAKPPEPAGAKPKPQRRSGAAEKDK